MQVEEIGSSFMYGSEEEEERTVRRKVKVCVEFVRVGSE